MSYSSLIKNIKINKNIPWVEKYRPISIDNIVSHTEILCMLKKFIDHNSMPHLLFFGPSGSGKTSTIMCCAREIYGEYMSSMTIILNASNERGIDTVRKKIKEFVSNKTISFLPLEKRNLFKMVIMDEIDSMTVEAQGMLRQTIEKNSASTRFCLICNDIDRINLALQSRCALFRFPPLKKNDIIERLKYISDVEHINITDDASEAIVKISKGDMRSAINTLQYASLTFGSDSISSDDIHHISGYCPPQINEKIFDLLIKLSDSEIEFSDCINNISELIIDNNVTIYNLLDELKIKVMKYDKINVKQKIYLIKNFAEIEKYDSINIDMDNIIFIITSIFVLIRQN